MNDKEFKYRSDEEASNLDAELYAANKKMDELDKEYIDANAIYSVGEPYKIDSIGHRTDMLIYKTHNRVLRIWKYSVSRMANGDPLLVAHIGVYGSKNSEWHISDCQAVVHGIVRPLTLERA